MFYQRGCQGQGPWLIWRLRDTPVKSLGSEHTAMVDHRGFKSLLPGHYAPGKTSVLSVPPLFPSMCLRHDSWWTPGIWLFSRSSPSSCPTLGGHSEELAGAGRWYSVSPQEGIPAAVPGPFTALPWRACWGQFVFSGYFCTVLCWVLLDLSLRTSSTPSLHACITESCRCWFHN